jgi:hypothetical protein
MRACFNHENLARHQPQPGSADWQSAVRGLAIRRHHKIGRLPDCQSGIQQVANLRYDEVLR